MLEAQIKDFTDFLIAGQYPDCRAIIDSWEDNGHEEIAHFARIMLETRKINNLAKTTYVQR